MTFPRLRRSDHSFNVLGALAFIAPLWVALSIASAPPAAGQDTTASAQEGEAAAEPAHNPDGSWVGAQAPEFTIEKLHKAPPGAKATLADLRGNVVVLAFWSTECPTCPDVIPRLNTLAHRFKDEPVVFLSILNETGEEVDEFLKDKFEVKTWIGLDEDMSVTADYFIPGVPMVTIVNGNGVVCARLHAQKLSPEVINAALDNKAVNTELPPLPRPLQFAFEQQQDAAAAENQLPLRRLSVVPVEMSTPRKVNHLGGVRLRGASLREAFTIAYGMDYQSIVSDTMLLNAKFNIDVVPGDGRESESPELMKQLLEETFQVDVRKEVGELEALVMRLPDGPGPGLKVSTAETANLQRDGSHFFATKIPLRVLEFFLVEELNQAVFDETETGAQEFDFTLSWDPKKRGNFKKALREQLGIELVPESREMELLKVERRNMPGASAKQAALSR